MASQNEGMRQAGQDEHAQRVVERAVLAHRADHAERHAEQHREDHGQHGQLQRHRQRGRMICHAGRS